MTRTVTILRQAGFAELARLTGAPQAFELVRRANPRDFVYVWWDTVTGEVLNVGDAAQAGSRFSGYKSWLNGKRRDSSNWQCQLILAAHARSPNIVIWWRQSSADKRERKRDETYWIDLFTPPIGKPGREPGRMFAHEK